MKAKKWIVIVLGLSIIFAILIGLGNYFIDPLWTFSHSNMLNSKQAGFDERQQKTNYILNRGLYDYDGLLLGSSRATFVNQKDFINMNIFNYSSNSMYPQEYKEYIDFFKKIKGTEPKYIILALDFFGTMVPKNTKFEQPKFYINNAESNLYKYKMIFSIDTFKKAITNILYSINGNSMYYNRNNIKYQLKVSEEERLKRYSENIKLHTFLLSNTNYIYNENYMNILKIIKNDNPNTKFLVYTSAITSNLLVSELTQDQRINDYERWLRELVTVFGEINHFMDINSITRNLQNYPDDDHAYPNILKYIANKLSYFESEDIPKDFGKLITKENINEYLLNFRQILEVY